MLLLVGHRHRVVPPERGVAGQHFVEHHPQRVNVAAMVDRVAQGLLGGQVGGGADHRSRHGEAVGGARHLGDPEVGDLGPTGVDQYVGRLDVAVDDPLTVGRGQRRRDIGGQTDGP